MQNCNKTIQVFKSWKIKVLQVTIVWEKLCPKLRGNKGSQLKLTIIALNPKIYKLQTEDKSLTENWIHIWATHIPLCTLLSFDWFHIFLQHNPDEEVKEEEEEYKDKGRRHTHAFPGPLPGPTSNQVLSVFLNTLVALTCFNLWPQKKKNTI